MAAKKKKLTPAALRKIRGGAKKEHVFYTIDLKDAAVASTFTATKG